MHRRRCKLPMASDLHRLGRTKEVVEAFESDAFASPGSPVAEGKVRINRTSLFRSLILGVDG